MLQSSSLRRELTSAPKVCILLSFLRLLLIIHTGKDRNTPLHLVMLNGYTDITKLLIEKGADISATSVYSAHLSLHLVHHPHRCGWGHAAASCILERPH